MKRNPSFSKIAPVYLFADIYKKILDFKSKHKNAKLISLSVGDTSLPIPHPITKAMEKRAEELSTIEGYIGYGDEQGDTTLRETIANRFYNDTITADEIFISDGAKCDLGRLQILFGPGKIIGVQDPNYPVAHDTSLAMGCKELIHLPTTPENDFFPDLNLAKKADVIFLSTPNNPTATALTRDQLEKLVSFAKEHGIIVVVDTVYNLFIEDKKIPRSIYEIDGGKEVAIEVCSFSKLINFTGVRLGWSVVPKDLNYEDGKSVRDDWKRIQSTFFNGASNIAEAGGIAALSESGFKHLQKNIAYYKENAQLLKKALSNHNVEIYGGDHAPFLWVRFPDKKSSWELFEIFLNKYHLITTPGSGFGRYGEGFLRFSTLGTREAIEEAVKRLNES